MKLRGKLILAQMPLAFALILVGVVSVLVTLELGDSGRQILADNYRSVLAAQRMKEAVERMGQVALMTLTPLPAPAAADTIAQEVTFELELKVEEGNLTEPGEREAAVELRSVWEAFRSDLKGFSQPLAPGLRQSLYLEEVQPALVKLKRLCDDVLAINQDTMVRKSEVAERDAERFQRVVVFVVLSALVAGFFVSAWMTTLTLRPLNVVSAAVRRFGEGDLEVRAKVAGKDEIAGLADEFNKMAGRLAQYRDSSLGELLQAQHAAQAAIDGLPDPVLLLDPQGHAQGSNQAAAQLLSLTTDGDPSDLLANTDPGVHAMVDRLRAHVFSGKGPYVPRGFEDAIRISEAHGTERIFLPRATPIYAENGSVSGAAIVLQDATRLFRFDELKNNLVATVAHEFRTPLTSLRMALHLCTEEVVGGLNAKQADLLFAAREDCERLQAIVDDLLNLSRLESGHIDLQRRRSDTEHLVRGAVEVHRAAATNAGVTLTVDVPPGMPEVFVDVDRIQLVFTNLISNAIRYSPGEGVVSIRVSGQASPSLDSHIAPRPAFVRVEIADSGPGIPAEHQGGLFEKFFRIPGSPEGGSGLGLFIAKGVVQAHGGDIGVTCPLEGGSCFWFTIPVAPDLG